MEAILLELVFDYCFCRRLSQLVDKSKFSKIIFFLNQWKRKPKKEKKIKTWNSTKTTVGVSCKKRQIHNLTNGECWTDRKIKNSIQWVEPVHNFWKKKLKKRRHKKKQGTDLNKLVVVKILPYDIIATTIKTYVNMWNFLVWLKSEDTENEITFEIERIF